MMNFTVKTTDEAHNFQLAKGMQTYDNGKSVIHYELHVDGWSFYNTIEANCNFYEVVMMIVSKEFCDKEILEFLDFSFQICRLMEETCETK